MKRHTPKPLVDVNIDKYALFQEKTSGDYYLIGINEIKQKQQTENIIYKCYPTTSKPEEGRFVIRLNDNGSTADIPKEKLHSVSINTKAHQKL